LSWIIFQILSLVSCHTCDTISKKGLSGAIVDLFIEVRSNTYTCIYVYIYIYML